MRAYLESRNHLKGSRWEQRCQWSKDAVKLVGILTQRQWYSCNKITTTQIQISRQN